MKTFSTLFAVAAVLAVLAAAPAATAAREAPLSSRAASLGPKPTKDVNVLNPITMFAGADAADVTATSEAAPAATDGELNAEVRGKRLKRQPARAP